MTRSPRAIVALLFAVLVALPVAATAQPSDGELQQELERAERDADALDGELSERRGELSAAEEELASIGARLADARAELRAAEGQVALAEQASDEAESERLEAVDAADEAEDELARTTEELQGEEEKLADQAIAAYKFGSVGARAGSAAFDVVRRAGDPNELAVGMHQIGRVIGDQGVTVERVAALRAQQDEQFEAAQAAQRRAQAAAADAAEQVRTTEQLREQAAGLAVQVADEEDRQAAVTAQLRSEVAESEASLQRIAARQSEISGELAQRRAEREAAAAAAAAEARRRASSEGSSQGGGGGGGSAGGPPMSGVCPVVGAVAGRDFSNDWGYPRSGGRSHQGNDIFADRGAPIVAIADATIVRLNRSDSGLGGLTITYRTGDGSEWYNAHLDEVEPGMAPGVSVSQGQQVGTVGNTGNARTTPPHNHIGRRVNGSWVNPWPTIAPMCR